MGFNYENTEIKTQMGGKIVRKVSIKNGNLIEKLERKIKIRKVEKSKNK